MFLLLALLLALTGCHTETPPTPQRMGVSAPPKQAAPTASAGFPRTVTDMGGKSLTLNAPPERIVSLAPGNTETLFALGLGDKITGDTSACDYPAEAKQKPHVSGAGGQIDTESVLAQAPDLVVADSSINQKAIETLEKAKVPVLDVKSKTVEETYKAMELLGMATGQEAKAKEIVTGMKARLETVRKTVAAGAKTKPKVLILYGVKPNIYTTGPGSFIDDLITVAGGTNIATEDTISAEKVVELQPDVIIVGGPELQAQIKQVPGWATGVPAVQNGKFFTPSDQGTLARPGPRLPQAAEELARYLHPELFK